MYVLYKKKVLYLFSACLSMYLIVYSYGYNRVQRTPCLARAPPHIVNFYQSSLL